MNGEDMDRRMHWLQLARELGQEDDFRALMDDLRREGTESVPQPVDREALEATLGQYIKNWAEGGPLSRALVANQTDAVLALLPASRQPVDREALAEALWRHDNRNALAPHGSPRNWCHAAQLEKDDFLKRADAVLAVLAGREVAP